MRMMVIIVGVVMNTRMITALNGEIEFFSRIDPKTFFRPRFLRPILILSKELGKVSIWKSIETRRHTLLKYNTGSEWGE